MGKEIELIKKKKEELSKKQEELDKKIAEIEEKQRQKERQKEMEKKQKEEEKRLADIMKAEQRMEELRRKGITSIHMSNNNVLLKKIFRTISSIQHEALFSFKKNQIEYCGVDPAHVVLYMMRLPSKLMDGYKLSKEQDVGVDVEKLYSILKRRKKTQIHLDKYKNNTFLYVSWKANIGHMERRCKLVDPASLPEPKIPKLSFPVKFDIKLHPFLEFLKEAEEIADHISITSSESGIKLEAKGDEDVVGWRIEGKHKLCRSLFSIDYLLEAVKSMNLFFTEGSLEMGTDNPLMLKGENKEGFRMEVLLAPRIESE